MSRASSGLPSAACVRRFTDRRPSRPRRDEIDAQRRVSPLASRPTSSKKAGVSPRFSWITSNDALGVAAAAKAACRSPAGPLKVIALPFAEPAAAAVVVVADCPPLVVGVVTAGSSSPPHAARNAEAAVSPRPSRPRRRMASRLVSSPSAKSSAISPRRYPLSAMAGSYDWRSSERTRAGQSRALSGRRDRPWEVDSGHDDEAERPLLGRGQNGAGDRRVARDRRDDRGRLPGQRRQGLHQLPQGRGVRCDSGAARRRARRRLHLAPRRSLEPRGHRAFVSRLREPTTRSTSWSTTPARRGAPPSTSSPRSAGTR